MTTCTRFAIGTFAAADGRPFAGLVLGDRVADLGPPLGSGVTTRALVDDWDRSLPRLQALADGLGPADAEHAIDDLPPLPPLEAGNVFCAGAPPPGPLLTPPPGAARRGDASDGLPAGARARARAELDERARTGRP